MLFISLMSLFLSSYATAQEELLTKQSIHKIRYISDDGKVTYYQKNSGELQMSTNYNFKNILKLSPHTQYLVSSSPTQSRVAISANENFYNMLNFRKDQRIFTTKLGDTDPPTEVGRGVFPQLHLKDTWISFFENKTFSYVFKSFNPSLPERRIKLNFHHSKYFTPQAYLLNLNNAIYIDHNDQDRFGVFLYSFIENKFELIYKAKKPGKRIQLCLEDNTLIIGEFPIISDYGGSYIVSINLYKGKLSKYTPLYSSNLPDIGNMICANNRIYFIKTLKENKRLNLKQTEVVSINPKSLKIKTLSKLKYVTHIFKMNNKIITNFRGKYHILEGSNDLANDQIIEDKKNE